MVESDIGQNAWRLKGTAQWPCHQRHILSLLHTFLVKSLEHLSHPKILAMIEDGPQKCTYAFLYEILDRYLIRSDPLFSVKPTALQIIFYTDKL
ncbi:unnamed protein product [Oncorhynchus mykiss]|uniref:Uncharacterized protein n=1 Tax=Oncorhynchus mykiss TaxID=8022 RepID=A0A060W6M4_ONCMY|nr:unnamed protein product [Oncorhynchus mykiss]